VCLELPQGLAGYTTCLQNLQIFFERDYPVLKKLLGPKGFFKTEERVRLDRTLSSVVDYHSSYITGVVDVLGYDPDTQTLILLDYKTGVESTSEAGAAITKEQLQLYVLLVHKALFPVSRYGLAVCALAAEGMRWLTPPFEPFDEKTEVQNLISKIKQTHTLLQDIHPQIGPYCKYCPHLNFCPAQREVTNGNM